MRKSQGRQSLREIRVGTSREAKESLEHKRGKFSLDKKRAEKIEFSGIDTSTRGNLRETTILKSAVYEKPSGNDFK